MRLRSPDVEIVLDGYRLGSDQGSIAFCAITLVEGLDDKGELKRILVDTGHTGRRPALDAALRQRGLTRDSIDIVVCTHAHWDHIENVDIFPRAEIAMHPDERRYVRRPHRNDLACPEWIDDMLARYEDRIRTVTRAPPCSRASRSCRRPGIRPGRWRSPWRPATGSR